LQKSIHLDPNLSAAHALLGKIYMQRKEFTEAEKHLTRAAQADSPNHLAHYYRALLYSLDPGSGTAGGAQTFRFRENYPPETAAKIRAELKEAARLEPDFPDSYYLLAQITLATHGDPAEAVRLLKHARRLAPGRERYAVLLAQAYLQSRKPQEARRILTPLAGAAADRQARHEARRLLKLMEERESPR
ncbi:MAG: tetratricopeptide repeat protein, partial [Acidobacteria bacterium]|nr:tetratricopeptide repeat protein [Acidobacteriota bacterium]